MGRCGSLNVIVPHKLIVTQVGGVALLVEVCHCGGIIYAQAMPSVSEYFLIPAGQDVGLTAPSPAPGLPALHHVAP